MELEWDEHKVEHNLQKHGISFREALSVFYDPLSITFDDPDHSGEEQRFIIIGQSSTGKLLLVAHTDRGDYVRIISARLLKPKERKLYATQQR